jgi:hypothetical protein
MSIGWIAERLHLGSWGNLALGIIALGKGQTRVKLTVKLLFGPFALVPALAFRCWTLDFGLTIA